jgi:predicted nucleic acid-binding protein
MILLDTSGLMAALDVRHPSHIAAKAAIQDADGPLLLSPFVLAELDYLIATRVSAAAEQSLLGEVGDGAYRIEPMDAADITEAADVIKRYRDLELGLADASVVVLSRRYDVTDVLTLDQRHFRAIQGSGGRPFRILPADA